MDALLINPNPGGEGLNEATIEPPLGLGYLAATLEKHHFSCAIIDANLLKLSENEIINNIPDDIKIIGLYCNSFSFDSVKQLCSTIKDKRKDALILIGGPLPSVTPETVLREIGCHGVIRGEGEFSLLKIAQNIRDSQEPFQGNISGLAYISKNGTIISNPVERITDLDSLPFPAIHLMPPLKLYKTRSRKRPICAIITSRGCAFGCSFCSKDIFQRKVTFRSAENVLSEIDYLVNTLGVRQIDVMDDNFAGKKSRMSDILDGLIERNYDLVINLQSGIRAENIDDEMLIRMKKAGVYKIAFGIESADEKVLKFHNKKLDLQKVEDVVAKSKKLGFVIYGFFIIGLPGETEEAFNKTIAFVKRLDFDVANFGMAIPFIGTELYRMVEKDGHFLVDTRRDIASGFYDGKVFFEYGDATEAVVSLRYRKAYKEIYTIWKQIKIILKIRSVHELVWLKDAILFVLRGMLKGPIRLLKGQKQ